MTCYACDEAIADHDGLCATCDVDLMDCIAAHISHATETGNLLAFDIFDGDDL